MQQIPVSELVQLPINWVRADDERLKTVFKSLRAGNTIHDPIRLLNCGCGKTYVLEDGGHRITAAYKYYKKTGSDLLIPVEKYVADFP
ncbi:hypothetical protein KFU94_49165 [Chloroflexi bacterium TSY]|nr:hypothetical protein [Chloroflexi bacterium TSY]